MTDDAERAATTREAFGLLSDETRLETLRALADRLRENPADPTVGFSELRRRVGMRDSGNFNYHLGKLEGRFVEKTDDGYRIAPAGLRVVAAAIAGTYGGGESMGPAELEDPCPVCGAALTATYEDGLLRVACPGGHEFTNTLPPGAVDERDLEAVIDLLTRTTHQDIELSLSGTCPFCYGRLPWSAEPPAGPVPEFDTQCPRCGVRMEVPAVLCLLQAPTGVGFFHDHGVDVRRRPLWAPVFYEEVTVSATAEGGVTVAVTRGGERLEGRFDASLTVESIRREDR
jgi:DNA-binding transcriptional ArsR family regulator